MAAGVRRIVLDGEVVGVEGIEVGVLFVEEGEVDTCLFVDCVRRSWLGSR